MENNVFFLAQTIFHSVQMTCVLYVFGKPKTIMKVLTISFDSKTELLVIVPLVNTMNTICGVVSPSSDTKNTAYIRTGDHKKAESDLV